MSLNLYDNNSKKPWLNPRINNLTAAILGINADNKNIGDILSVTATGYQWIPSASVTSASFSSDCRQLNQITLLYNSTRHQIFISNLHIQTDPTTYSVVNGALNILKAGKYILFFNITAIPVAFLTLLSVFTFELNNEIIHRTSSYVPPNPDDPVTVTGSFIISINESYVLPSVLKIYGELWSGSQDNCNVIGTSCITTIRLT